MSPEILLVRTSDGYRILHGHLRLASVMSMANEVIVDASGEGKVKAIKALGGILVGEGLHRLPLLLFS